MQVRKRHNVEQQHRESSAIDSQVHGSLAPASSVAAGIATVHEPPAKGDGGWASPAAVSAFFTVIVVLVLRADAWLPTALDVDVAPTRFSEARARSHLRDITALGVRTVGSRANEELAPALIKSIVEGLAAAAARVEGPNHALVEIQRPGTGAYSSAFLDGFTNVYSNVSNVLVLVGPRGGGGGAALQPRLLLGAHFDSALGAPAASDDTAMVAVLLEVVSNLLAGPRLEVGLVINLNGAEETNWMAAHGFATSSHKWASAITTVINLEAVGSGGRDYILQIGPRNEWLAELYTAHAPHPHGTCIIQEVFEIPGAIPGQTDFQVYRDYGGAVGIELIWLSGGQVYHTSLDVEAAIPSGAIQHTGDNVLSLVNALLASPHLPSASPSSGEPAVYFDVLGTHLISYGKRTGALLNLAFGLTAVVSALTAATRAPPATAAAAFRLLAWRTALGVGMPLCLALIITATGHSLAWYAHVGAAVLVYVAAATLGIAIAHARGHGGLLAASGSSVQGAMLMLQIGSGGQGALTLFLTALGFRTAFMGTLWSGSLATLLLIPPHLLTPPGCSSRLLGWCGGSATHGWIILQLVACALPVCVWLQHLLLVVDFFTPLLGRSGAVLPPELVLGTLIGVIITGATCIPLSLLHVQPSCSSYRQLCRFCALLLLLGLVYLATLHPYSPTHPKRLFLQHVEMINGLEGLATAADSASAPAPAPASTPMSITSPPSHSTPTTSVSTSVSTSVCTSSFLWINSMDYLRLQPIEAAHVLAPIMSRSGPNYRIDETCHGPYCCQPWYFPVWKMVGPGWWLTPAPLALPASVPRPSLDVLSEEKLAAEWVKGEVRASGARRVRLRLSGPCQMNLILPASLLGWSFATPLPTPRPDCNCHFVFLATGTSLATWTFDLTLPLSPPHDNETMSAADPHPERAKDRTKDRIVFYGHYLEYRTPLLEEAEAALPAWVTPVSFVSLWGSKDV
mmetsp:Transcript_69323/g.137454  ORF Transcript_69323/g.137454 Transcript_69323/m.137454 type:complete len:968 (-) Transcript_69323:91-2994(-)